MGRERDIYGDDYYDQPHRWPDSDSPAFAREEFRIQWPPGYWEEYARMRDEARRLANDPSACLIMKLNGRFQVRTIGLVIQDRGYEFKYSFGPEMDGRLEAWAAFIDSISTKPVRELKALAGKTLKINMSRIRKGANRSL